MAFKSRVVPEDWRSAVIIPLYKGKGERIECRNYRSISFLIVICNIYSGILVDSFRRVNQGLIEDERGSFRLWRECVNQILT